MKKVKQRKMLMVLPLLVIPFLTMAFWAMGGGKGQQEAILQTAGLNLNLPDAQSKEEKLMDKLSFYEKADKDSMKLDEWMRSDPYYKKDSLSNFPSQLDELSNLSTGKYGQRLNNSPFDAGMEKPEDKLLDRLKQLETELSKSTASSNNFRNNQSSSNNDFSLELERLEQLMKANNSQGTEDPEMKQLEGTLDKILDIQHPERVKNRSIKNKGVAYSVTTTSGKDTIVNGFFSYSDPSEMEPVEQNAIEAIVASTQTIVNGSVVKFRLLSEVYINGMLIPKDNLISGIATLEGERLQVEINSIRAAKSIYGVKLSVFDMDGLPGIYIPGAINREVAKESLNNSLTLADMTSVDPSFKAQAATTGIGAIKSLVGKKAKLVRVQLKAGYKVLLNNKN